MKKTTHTRGAPLKNKNAVRHGIYSQFIVLADESSLKEMTAKTLIDELAIARVSFKNAMLERQNSKSVKDKLSWDNAAHYWLDTIIAILKQANENLNTVNEIWDSFMSYIRSSNDRQGVK